jgi:hypothetical protein
VRISKISGNHSLSESPLAKNRLWENRMIQHPAVHRLQSHVQKPGYWSVKEGLAGVIIKGIGIGYAG